MNIKTLYDLPQEVALLKSEIQELKQLIQETSNNKVERKEHISIREVGEITEYSKGYLYQLVEKGLIPCHKPGHGRKLVFLRSEIEEWFTARKKESPEEYCDRKEAELSNRLNMGGR